MTSHNPWASGIVLRILYLGILTAALIVGGFVYLENRELHKVVPPTAFTNIAVLLGQSLALAGVNYILAYRGNNLADVITECLLVFAGIVTLVSFQAPHMFLKLVGQEEIKILTIGTGRYRNVFGPNYIFYLGFLVSLIMIIIVACRVRAHSVSNDQTTGSGNHGVS